MRRAFDLARGDPPNLVELGHQVDARVQSPGGVDQDDVAPASLARGDRVEHHRRRVGAGPRPDDVHAGAVAQISSCSTAAARNVSAAQITGERPDSLISRASFPIVVVLPVPLTPTISTTCGRWPLPAGRPRP